MLNFYIDKSASFILWNKLSLTLDLEYTSNYTVDSTQTIVGDLLVSGSETKVLESILTNNFMADAITRSEYLSSPGLQVTLECTTTTTSVPNCKLNVIARVDATCTTSVNGQATHDHSTPLSVSGSRLFAYKAKSLDIIFTTEGIFVWQAKRSKLLSSLLIPILHASNRLDAGFFVTSTGVYTTPVDDLLLGNPPVQKLTLTETVLDLLVDKLDFMLVFSTRTDFYKDDSFTNPISILGLPSGVLLNNNFYYTSGGFATVIELPYTSSSFSDLGNRLTYEDYEQGVDIGGLYISDTLSYKDGYIRILDDGEFKILKDIRTFTEIPTILGTESTCGMVGDIIWVCSANLSLASSQWSSSAYDYPRTGVNVVDFFTFRISGAGLTAELTFLDRLAIDDHTVYSSMLSYADYYNYVVYPNIRPTTEENGSPVFSFYTRASIERTQYLSTGGTASMPTSYFHTVTFNSTTGIFTDTRQTLTRGKADYPSLNYQNFNYNLNSALSFRQEDTTELMFTGREYHMLMQYISYSLEYLPYTTTPRQFLSFPDLTYDEETDSLPRVSLYETKNIKYLDIIDSVSIDADRVCTFEGDRDGYIYAALYSKRLSNKRSDDYKLELLCEPVIIAKLLPYSYSPAYSSRPEYDDLFQFEVGTSSIGGNDLTLISFAHPELKNILLRIGKTTIVPLLTTGRALSAFTIGKQLSIGSFRDGNTFTTAENNEAGVYGTAYEYHNNPKELSNCTQWVKGNSPFVISDNKLYGVYDVNQARLIHDDCIEVRVSPDATINSGFAIIKTSTNELIIKALAGEAPRLVTIT